MRLSSTNTFHKFFRFLIKLNKILAKDVKQYKTPNFVNVMKETIDYSDGVIESSEKIREELIEYAKSSNKPFLPYQTKEKYINAYSDFYDKIMST